MCPQNYKIIFCLKTVVCLLPGTGRVQMWNALQERYPCAPSIVIQWYNLINLRNHPFSFSAVFSTFVYLTQQTGFPLSFVIIFRPQGQVRYLKFTKPSIFASKARCVDKLISFTRRHFHKTDKHSLCLNRIYREKISVTQIILRECTKCFLKLSFARDGDVKTDKGFQNICQRHL